MAAYGIRPRHRLGQNFLIDSRILDAIIQAAEISSTDVVLEIGPGLGTLTQRLARAAGNVVAIELDRALIEILKKTLVPHHPNLEIVYGDAATVNIDELLAVRLPDGQRAKVVANLPYYITTPLVMRLLEDGLPLDRVIVMVQKEVADRMVSPPGSKEYGALSVAVQYYTEPSIVAKVRRGAFFPPPDVESAIVALKLRTVPPVNAPRAQFFRVVRAAFGQRRKTLGNALAAGLNIERQDVQARLKEIGIDPGRRGETLSLEEFASVTRTLSTKMTNVPEKGVTDKV